MGDGKGGREKGGGRGLIPGETKVAAVQFNRDLSHYQEGINACRHQRKRAEKERKRERDSEGKEGERKRGEKAKEV